MKHPQDKHVFDKDYWDQHWHQAGGAAPADIDSSPPNPYLLAGAGSLTPGAALDAGCGAGAEAIWLATQGWSVTAVDIAADALAGRSRRASDAGMSRQVRWVEADLTVWSPNTDFDLVSTHYAHPAMPQLAFYDRIAEWVAPGGTLLIVGHLHVHDALREEHHAEEHGSVPHGQHPPTEAMVTVANITALLDEPRWEIVRADEHLRTVPGPGGQEVDLHDVIVQANRRR
jgi:SAM-dependent methyltransferase